MSVYIKYVLKHKQARGLLFNHLRTGQKVYKKCYDSKDRRGAIPNKISIDNRPDILQNKNELEILKST